MYSDVLDELNEYDTNYNIQDHLPRVNMIFFRSLRDRHIYRAKTQSLLFFTIV
jgi:hypothetical protein